MKKFSIINLILIYIICLTAGIVIVSCNTKDTEDDPSLIQSILELDNQIREDIDKMNQYDINDIHDKYDDGKRQTETNYTTEHLNESYYKKDDKSYIYIVPTAQSLEYSNNESKIKIENQFYKKIPDYKNDPEYVYLNYVEEYETPRGKISYVKLSKKRKGSKLNQFDHYIRYFYNESSELVKLTQDYVLPYLGKDEHIIQIDENGYIIAIEMQPGSFMYKYYTKDGNNYRTELENGNSLRTAAMIEEYNNKQYITNLSGAPLKQYILIPEGSDYDKTIENYYKGENTIFVNPKDIEDEFKLIRNNKQQAKLIDENIKNDDYAKELYLKAKSYSTIINSNNPDIIALNELVGSDGYVDDLPKNYQGSMESLADYNNFTSNPVNKRGFVEVAETNYVFIRDYAKVIHIMDKSKAEEYTEEIFKEIRDYINSDESNRSEAKQRINKYNSNVKVIQAGKQIKNQINSKTKAYIKDLQKLYNSKWFGEE